MNRFLHYSRITWTVTCGITALLLIVLWVRSYWCAEVVARFSPGWYLNVGSNHGIIYFVYKSPNPKYGSVSTASTPHWGYARIAVVVPGEWWNWKDLGATITGQLPDFLLVGLCMVGAILSWWPRQYSLRTLLIVTTLVAMALGLIVWAARSD